MRPPTGFAGAGWRSADDAGASAPTPSLLPSPSPLNPSLTHSYSHYITHIIIFFKTYFKVRDGKICECHTTEKFGEDSEEWCDAWQEDGFKVHFGEDALNAEGVVTRERKNFQGKMVTWYNLKSWVPGPPPPRSKTLTLGFVRVLPKP